ncbi:hypothetical protein [Sphaerospermopsis aphanizomenoides]|nr:hypothetical protein [Sphaerospermopsis aphanizomenoides]
MIICPETRTGKNAGWLDVKVARLSMPKSIAAMELEIMFFSHEASVTE